MESDTRAEPLGDVEARHIRATAEDDDGTPCLYVGDGETGILVQHDPLHVHKAAEALLLLADEIRAYALTLPRVPSVPAGPSTTPVGTPWTHGPLTGPIGWPGL